MGLSTIRNAGLAAAALLASAGTAQAAEFIVNGDFSSPFTTSYINTQPVPGWKNKAETYIEVGNSNVYGLPCINATCTSAEVNNNTFGDLVQTFSGLVIGKSYFLSFSYGGRSGGGPQSVDIFENGVNQVTASSDGVNSFWTLGSDTFVATSTTGSIEFKANNLGGQPGYGNEITNVSVTGPSSVPEPTTWAMMFAGFAMIGFGLRRRKAALSVSYS
jgi:hypothetical protein